MSVRCLGCMQIKSGSPVCEHCGYDENSRNNTHQLPAGTVVGGQYLLGRVLGQGGFGITYIGWDQIMNQTVAVKEYFPSGYAGRDSHSLMVTSYDNHSTHDFENNKRRFLREAESLAKLWNNPQIVKILRHFEDNGTAYIAMEYVEGMDLRKKLKSLGRPMTVKEVLDTLGPVMEALSLVHKAALVHRDISPDNIMVLPDGSAKLLDFGAARYVENANAEADRNTSTQAILKHGFAPPEQYQTHGALGPWTDVYAMCATIYFCLTGKVPTEAMTRFAEGDGFSWDGIPGLTDRQKAALKKGMTLQAKHRTASMEELWEGLKPDEPKPQTEKLPEKPQPAKPAAPPKPVEKPTVPVKQPETPKLESRISVPVPEKKPVSNNKPRKKWLPLVAVAAVLAAVIGIDTIYGSNDQAEISVPTETVTPTAAIAITEASIENTVATEPESYTLKYEHNDSGLTITGYEGMLSEHLVIPDEMDGVPVTIIGKEAFLNCTKLQHVSTGGNVTDIKSNAFDGCTNIKTITLSDRTTSIGLRSFADCTKLSSVAIPSSVKTIEKAAFVGCTSLEDVNIPDSVTYIGFNAFGRTPWYETAKRRTAWLIRGDGILMYYGSVGSEVEIPDSVKMISGAFANCTYVTSITIPDSVTIIGDNAFDGCVNLSRVVIPDSVTSIGDYAFDGCTNLSRVVIPDSVISIGSNAFNDCTALKQVTIPNGVTRIESYAFSGCTGLTSITLPNSVVYLGVGAFSTCHNLANVTLSNSLSIIEFNTFFHCWELKHITIPQSVTTIDGMAFCSCGLRSVTFPQSITSIGDEAFFNTDLTTVSIPKNCNFRYDSFPEGCTVNRY